MAISKEELHRLVELLPEAASVSAYDYLKYLAGRHSRPDWEEIHALEPDETPLSDEEKRQLESEPEFVSWEDAMRELDLSTDLKP